jgi:hypothetical protein
LIRINLNINTKPLMKTCKEINCQLSACNA